MRTISRSYEARDGKPARVESNPYDELFVGTQFGSRCTRRRTQRRTQRRKISGVDRNRIRTRGVRLGNHQMVKRWIERRAAWKWASARAEYKYGDVTFYN